VSEYPTSDFFAAELERLAQADRSGYIRRKLTAMGFETRDPPTLASRMAAEPTQDWT